MVLNREELAWAAGFFDGEGWVGRRSPDSGGVQLRIGNTDRALLERFKRAVGDLGSITGPYKPTVLTRKPMYGLNIFSFGRCMAVAGLLWRWLGSSKRLQFANALSGARKHRAKLYRFGYKKTAPDYRKSFEQWVRSARASGLFRIARRSTRGIPNPRGKLNCIRGHPLVPGKRQRVCRTCAADGRARRERVRHEAFVADGGIILVKKGVARPYTGEGPRGSWC